MVIALSLLALVGLGDVAIVLSRQRARLAQVLAAVLWCVTGVLLAVWSQPGVDVLVLVVGLAGWGLTYVFRSPGAQLAAATGVGAIVIWQLWPILLERLNAIGTTTDIPAVVSSTDWESGHWLLLGASVLIPNMATANRVVRMVLGLARRPPDSPQDEPAAAGRFIGAVERLLLVALILAGQGVSIAGVAAAKGIIRYPEISRTARHQENGLSAEVFFIGTATSWLFAVASAGLIALLTS